MKPIQSHVNSEIGELEAVILHSPGKEVEDMTPENAERALYSDILNLQVAQEEYEQFRKVLAGVAQTFEVKDLLKHILLKEGARKSLIEKICGNEGVCEIRDYLEQLGAEELSSQLLLGVPMVKNNLSKFLSKDRYSLQPLHNFFFTRDASVSIWDDILISRMKSQVREREAIIIETIFDHHNLFFTNTINPMNVENHHPNITIEGGDVLIARDDILIIGLSSRTSSEGIDFVLERFLKNGPKKHLLVQELPPTPESFIHLDMVFTFLNTNECMIYEPLILDPNRFRTVHITTDNGKVSKIEEEKNLLDALQKLDMQLFPIHCGGSADPWTQEREQWHSGANFFAIGPGKVIGYGRNSHTIEELNKNGFEVIPATDVISKKKDLADYQKFVVTIDGSELSRGGGGCRCMTMPFRRKDVSW